MTPSDTPPLNRGTTLRTVAITRYVTPLREGGSLPAVVEADDQGSYVLKFRGAGQGSKALAAELIGGELARAIGLPVPEIVFAELDAELARTEADPEIQELIQASVGLNLALDYLPGAVNFDPVADQVSGSFASQVVWFDALISNVDRSSRNTNLMIWHRRPWLIDHGAALYFHHAWNGSTDKAGDPFPIIKEHVLLPRADAIAQADAQLAPRITRPVLESILAQVPDDWLIGDGPLAEPDSHRSAYVEYFLERLKLRHCFVEEAIRARG